MWIASGACTGDGGGPGVGDTATTMGSSGSGGDEVSTGVHTDGDSEALPVSFPDDIQPILNGSCLCHMQDDEGAMEAPYLTLNPGLAEANLVESPAMGAAGIDLVAPGQPQTSYLWLKLNGTHADVGGDGDRMPPLGPLRAEEMELISRWIDGL